MALTLNETDVAIAANDGRFGATLYGTFGSGQPGFPGYLRIHVTAESQRDARHKAAIRMNDATDGKWCAIYNSLKDLHKSDRMYRGEA